MLICEHFSVFIAKIISYNKCTGPYEAEDMAQKMKFWNQNNETCKFQYDQYGEL